MHKPALVTAILFAVLAISSCSSNGLYQDEAEYRMINLAEAKAMHERDVLFIDIRSTHNYDEGHIPGAANIDPRRFTASSLARVARKDQEIVFYCYGIGCPVSEKATSKALSWGYQKVYLFMKGFPAWWNAGYPIEKST